MATYQQIQARVKARAGTTPKTCHIAEVKRAHGLTSGPAPNRKDGPYAYPCPSELKAPIEEALRHFGMLTGEAGQ